MTALLRLAFVTVVLGALTLLGYWRFMVDHQAKTIADLQSLNDRIQQRLEQREAMMVRLSRSRRIAHLLIDNQQLDHAGQALQTSLTFIELDDRGLELGRQPFTIPGDVVYVDAWTVKFDAEKVAEGDPLRGRTMVLLKRIYSEKQAPADGMPIDTPGAVPPGYAASDIGQFEKRVWENFWAIASDPVTARDMGVRVAQGEAVYKPVRTGDSYELIVDAAGGMSLMPLIKKDDALTQR